MVKEIIEAIGALTAFLIIFVFALRNYMKSHEEIDGVKSLHGIQYLIKNTDIEYVMYKLSSTCMSKVIKEKKFEQIASNVGLLTFGGATYNLGGRGADADGNVGATYKVQVKQVEGNVVMEIAFVENRRPIPFVSASRYPDVALSQVHHRFFKEQFDVVVLSKNEK